MKTGSGSEQWTSNGVPRDELFELELPLLQPQIRTAKIKYLNRIDEVSLPRRLPSLISVKSVPIDPRVRNAMYQFGS